MPDRVTIDRVAPDRVTPDCKGSLNQKGGQQVERESHDSGGADQIYLDAANTHGDKVY